MVVVDPGVYQDRAGVLFGPFSPIYGFGAVLMTIALNRFYKANPIIIFLVSAVIGGLFEFFVSWVYADCVWRRGLELLRHEDLRHTRPHCHHRAGAHVNAVHAHVGRPGVCVDQVLPAAAAQTHLPHPWKIRYSFTALCTVLMLVNGVMTLQALDCWFERVSGVQPNSPVEEFYAEHFDDAYMEHRFQSMTITPENSSRVDSSAVAK